MSDALARVNDAVERIAVATSDRNVAMRAARDEGATWSEVARAAGLTENGARYALGVGAAARRAGVQPT